MTSNSCIDIIKEKFVALIDSGKLNATYQSSKKTISFYVNDIKIGERPLLTLRISNHRPVYQNYINKKRIPPSGENNTNISIEFYQPKYAKNKKKIKDRVDSGIIIPHDMYGIVPFVVASFKYIPERLDETDVELIYNAILTWIYGVDNAEYKDPLAGSEKEAKVVRKEVRMKYKIPMNISVDKDGNYVPANACGADYVSENSNLIYLKNMIKECLKETINESYSVRRLAEFDVVRGDNQPHTVKGLEQYKDKLYDVRMYHSKDVTYCLFSIGKNARKYICCRLEYDKEYGTWLGFTPIPKHKVPTIIKQDLKEHPTN